ncbi:MAG: ribose 5-phosphate isomerase B [Hyphomonadaceae bacterium]|nr:ribose 5-phosphate isomerase B [Clostridia bacterium]
MIILGADHGGYMLKEHVKSALLEKGVEVTDIGIFEVHAVDYPDVAQAVCQVVLENEDNKGILICGTGIGISMAANKVNGIRCALLSDCYSARMAAEHNNANVIALGGRVLGVDLAMEIVNTFLATKFQGERHQKRVDKMHALEI